ncbi:myosin light chain kinase 3-like, partial [Rhinophrynus dorsalis]
MSKQDSIASCLAKMYESKLEQSTGPGKSVRKGPEGVNNLDKKLNLLNEKMDKLLHFQEDVMGQLEIVHHGMDMLEKGMDILTAFRGPTHEIIPEVGLNPSDDVKQGREQSACSELIRLLKMMHEDSVVHREKLDSLEKMVSTMDKVVAFVGNTLRNSKIVEFILKGTVPWKRETKEQAKDKTEEKEAKAKNGLGSGQKSSADTKKGSTLEDNRGLSRKTSQDGSTHALESALQTDDR